MFAYITLATIMHRNGIITITLSTGRIQYAKIFLPSLFEPMLGELHEDTLVTTTQPMLTTPTMSIEDGTAMPIERTTEEKTERALV
jgi:hypothetical protein